MSVNDSQTLRRTSQPLLKELRGGTRVFFIRHVEVEEAWSDKIYGQLDVKLGVAGEKRATRLLFRLRAVPFNCIYSSDLQRAAIMGESMVRMFGLSHVRDLRLRERHYGDWQGKTWAELEENHLDDLRAYEANRSSAPPGGESLQQVNERVGEFVDEIVRRHVGEQIVVIAHANVIRGVVCDALKLPGEKAFNFLLRPGSVTIVDYRNVNETGRNDAYIAMLNG